jgi:hypothetical protein
LQELAWSFARKRRPLATPKQRAAKLTVEIKKLEAAVEVLGPPFIPLPFADIDEVVAFHAGHRAERASVEELATLDTSTVHDVARAALQRLIAYRRQLRDMLATRGSRSSGSAKKRHIQFWRELTHLWRTLQATKQGRHKHLHQFLRACSTPIFPAETKDKTLIAFIERLSKR